MTVRRLNAGFLSTNELDAMGVCDAKNRNILVHSTAVIVNFDDIFLVRISGLTLIPSYPARTWFWATMFTLRQAAVCLVGLQFLWVIFLLFQGMD